MTWPRHEAAHRAFDASIAACWRAVDDPPSLACAAVALEATIDNHVRWEERTVYPAYLRAVPNPEPTARVEVLTRDHEIVRRRLDALVTVALQSLTHTIPTLLRAQAIDAVAATLEHHDAREARHVYPALTDPSPDDGVPPHVAPPDPARLNGIVEGYRTAALGAPARAWSLGAGRHGRALDALLTRAEALARANSAAPPADPVRRHRAALRVDEAWRAALWYALAHPEPGLERA